MERSGALHAFGARAAALGTVVVLGLLAGEAHAADAAAGGPALRQARAAWDRRALETAEPLYREALEKGGLAPNEVLEGYVRLGSIRAVLGKRDSAIAAFRAASILDSDFNVPGEAGSKGAALAERAKRDTAKIGSIQLAVQAPREVQPGKSFTITATLDKAHLPIVSRIGVIAKDGTTGKEVSLDAKPDEAVEFEIDSDITLPGASILVHVDALDGHDNRLASTEERVRVPEKDTDKGAVAGRSGSKEGSGGSGGDKPAGDPDVRKGGAFWSSPWPYVIGGIALVGAGTAVFFGTRPSPNVSVGQVGVREQ
ncbi:MAG: tetratricopeptide repeat protein [Labilithrix sp.]|nr:tetratricopeptide repeat protein [Labilithrix sp.]